MSDVNALAAVTAAMKRLLVSRLPQTLGDARVDVTTETPLAVEGLTTSDQVHRLNLYLYEVRPSAAFRNQPPPAGRVGSSGQVPLALELYYLLTPYPFNEDHESEGQQLLGMGILAFHDLCSIGPSAVHLLDTDPPQDLLGELLRIVPVTMGGEEMARLWSALQAPLRLSAAFQVSPVFIQSQLTPRAAPPVLRRGPGDGGADVSGRRAVFPEATRLELVSNDPNAVRRRPATLAVFEAGERVRLVGSVLMEPGQTSRVLLSPQGGAGGDDIALPPIAALSNPSAVVFDLTAPQGQTSLAAGMYSMRVEVPHTLQATGPGGVDTWSSPRTTNELPLLLAPRINALAVETPATGAQIRAACTPPVSAGQRVLLIVGDRPLALGSQSADGGTLIFVLPAAPDQLPSGDYMVRLRVDGVDSLAASAADPFNFGNKVTLP
jgi:hypothetical protein